MGGRTVRATALGGSGENGRNCFLVDTPAGGILLNCGVKRETIGTQVGLYPALTREIVSCLCAVFLSHAHEDHVAALPYLHALGYSGPVYATAETAAMTPDFCVSGHRTSMRKAADCPLTTGTSPPFA